MRLIALLLLTTFYQAFCAQGLEYTADSLSRLEAYTEANVFYAQLADEAFRKNAYDQFLALKTKQASNLQSAGEDQEALQLLEEALDAIEGKVVEDTVLAAVHHKIGVSQYNLEDYNMYPAIESWRQALRLRKRSLPPNHLQIIRTLRNIGTAYEWMSRHESAREYLSQSLDLHLSRPQADSILLALTYRELGIVFSNLRDFNQATIHLDIAFDWYRRLYVNEPWNMVEMYEALFVLYKAKKDSERMISSCKEALSLYGGMENKIDDDYWMMADIYSNLGLTYEFLDSIDLALHYLKRSIAINQEYGALRQKKLAVGWSGLSLVYRKMKRYDLALGAIDKAIQIDIELDDPLGIAANLNNKTDFLFNQGKLEEALAVQHRAIQYIVPGFQGDNLLEDPSANAEVVGSKPRLVNYLAEKARIYSRLAEQSGDTQYLAAAARNYLTIAQLVDQIRLGFESDDSKQFLSEDVRALFEKGVDVYYRLYEIDAKEAYLQNAFLLAEKSKAAVLLDALNEAQALTQAGIPKHLIERERLLKHRIMTLEDQLFQGDKDMASHRDELIRQNRALENLLDTFKIAYPDYFNLKYNVRTSDLQEVKQRLGEYSLLEYVVGEQAIYVFTIGGGKADFKKLLKPALLENWVTNLRYNITAYHLSNLRSDAQKAAGADTLLAAAHQLYQSIFKPIEQLGIIGEQLIVIPDGVLGYVPFESLVRTLPSDNTLFGTHDYLIEDYQISYNYSASLLHEMQSRTHSRPQQQYIGFAPLFGEPTAGFGIAAEKIVGQLVPLRYNLDEVKSVRRLLGGQYYANASATEAAFREKAPKASIIHLATHGQANDLAGDFAYLAFTVVPDSAENELLYNRELYNLRLQAEMVVLSACETGIGELRRGEGVISLARGFSYAGAKSIITTLWSVNDAKTNEFMLSFYRYLKAGLAKDIALRKAKLDFIDAYSHDAHPFYWAGFIAIGDMSPLELSSNTFSPGYLLLILGLFMIGYFLWRRA